MYYIVYYHHGTWKVCDECAHERVGPGVAWDLAFEHLKRGHPVKVVPFHGRAGNPCPSRA